MRTVVYILWALALVACSSERSRPESTDCPNWVEDIGPQLSDRCATCHGGASPSGAYDVTSYEGVLGGGTDSTPNVIAGDASSRLLAVIAPGSADADHAAFADLHPIAETWITACNVEYIDSPIHPGGIMNPADPDFHGTLIRDTGYDFPLCATCHSDPEGDGTDFSGGKSGASCLTCHDQGPTDCQTCHNTPPTDRAHTTHLNGRDLSNGFACTECHTVPTAWDDPGHVLLANGAVDPPPADVVFGATARATPAGYTRTGDPTYDIIDKRCSNVYCHGGVFGDGNATNPTPEWDGANQASCGSCHGTPPASHANNSCTTCHPRAFDDAGVRLKDNHIDVIVQVGKTGSGCNDCHGIAADGAPPTDLAGNTATTALGVGAHQVHLTVPKGMTGPIACNQCHVVPTEVGSPGHIDSAGPAEVFPGGASFAGLASAMSAVPMWDRGTATCSDVYCHGGGDLVVGDIPNPVWTAVGVVNQAYCGSCHGVPPATALHAGMTLGDCSGCHGSIAPNGLPIITGPPGSETSEHIDGIITF